MRVGKRFEEQSVYERENRGVGADRKSEGEDYGDCESRIAHEHAHAEADVLVEIVPPEPTVGFVEALFGLQHVTESAAGGGLCVFGDQALLEQAVTFQWGVGLCFGPEGGGFLFGSEKG